MCALKHSHSHTHFFLEAYDLCPPSDPRVHEILDLVGGGGWGFYSQVHDFRDGHEIVTFAYQPWLKNFSPRTLSQGMGKGGGALPLPLTSPHLSARAGPGALGGELGRGAGTRGGGAPKRAPGGVLLRR